MYSFVHLFTLLMTQYLTMIRLLKYLLVSKTLVASAIGIQMDEKGNISFMTRTTRQIFSFGLSHPILLERRRRRGAVLLKKRKRKLEHDISGTINAIQPSHMYLASV